MLLLLLVVELFCDPLVIVWNINQFNISRWAFAARALRMLTYNTSGELAECQSLLKEQGFDIGQHVMRKADQITGTITGFTQNHVVLSIESGMISGTCKVLAAAFSKREWTHSVPKKQVEELQDLGWVKGAVLLIESMFKSHNNMTPCFFLCVFLWCFSTCLPGTLAAPDLKPH